MLQISPRTKVYVCLEPIDFRMGIQGISGVVRGVLNEDPLSGHLFIFRNARNNCLKALIHDGQGMWLALKRLSCGTFRWWPQTLDEARSLNHAKLQVLLANGNPQAANFQEDWRPVA